MVAEQKIESTAIVRSFRHDRFVRLSRFSELTHENVRRGDVLSNFESTRRGSCRPSSESLRLLQISVLIGDLIQGHAILFQRFDVLLRVQIDISHVDATTMTVDVAIGLDRGRAHLQATWQRQLFALEEGVVLIQGFGVHATFGTHVRAMEEDLRERRVRRH